MNLWLHWIIYYRNVFKIETRQSEVESISISLLSCLTSYVYTRLLRTTRTTSDDLIGVTSSSHNHMSIFPGIDVPAQIQELQRIVANDPAGKSWDVAWKGNLTPWDKGGIQAPLEDLIESGKVPFPTSGKALVPGCGRGYDAVYIASRLGLDTTGMDISETAVEAANQIALFQKVQG